MRKTLRNRLKVKDKKERNLKDNAKSKKTNKGSKKPNKVMKLKINLMTFKLNRMQQNNRRVMLKDEMTHFTSMIQ